MANELSNLKPAPGSRKKPLRVGRGEGSGKGKTAGRGTKGQHARSTVKRGFEGGQMPLARRLPKRGFTNIFKKDYSTVRLDLIAARFEAGEVVDTDSLRAKGLIRKVGKDGVKVLGNGSVEVALTVRAQKFTGTARDKIVAAGGTVEEVSL
jgi:large subunit ribosomal protein L15